jgi:beta-lactamase superfamily II metal-dependent hydrolase
MIKGASKPIFIAVSSLATLSGVGAYAWHVSAKMPVLEIYVWDTPGASSIFIRTPSDKRFLIDGGSNSDVIRRLTEVIPFYSRRIDTIIVTNREAKRTTGLVEVADRYHIGNILIPGIDLLSLGLASTTDPAYAALLETAEKHDIAVQEVLAGKRLELDKEVYLDVVFPVPEDSFEYSRASAPELVMRLSYRDISILLAGTISTKVQKYLSKDIKHSNILVIYQSLTPSNYSREFMAAVMPDSLVYSQAVVKSPAKKSSTKKKPQPDILAGVLMDHRFNIKEKKTILIVSDGAVVTVVD